MHLYTYRLLYIHKRHGESAVRRPIVMLCSLISFLFMTQYNGLSSFLANFTNLSEAWVGREQGSCGGRSKSYSGKAPKRASGSDVCSRCQYLIGGHISQLSAWDIIKMKWADVKWIPHFGHNSHFQLCTSTLMDLPPSATSADVAPQN